MRFQKHASCSQRWLLCTEGQIKKHPRGMHLRRNLCIRLGYKNPSDIKFDRWKSMQRPVAFSRYSSTDTARMAGAFCCRPDFFQTPRGISIEHERISRFCQRKNTLSGWDCQGEGTECHCLVRWTKHRHAFLNFIALPFRGGRPDAPITSMQDRMFDDKMLNLYA